jgi:hypothetical protein
MYGKAKMQKLWPIALRPTCLLNLPPSHFRLHQWFGVSASATDARSYVHDPRKHFFTPCRAVGSATRTAALLRVVTIRLSMELFNRNVEEIQPMAVLEIAHLATG